MSKKKNGKPTLGLKKFNKDVFNEIADKKMIISEFSKGIAVVIIHGQEQVNLYLNNDGFSYEYESLKPPEKTPQSAIKPNTKKTIAEETNDSLKQIAKKGGKE